MKRLLLNNVDPVIGKPFYYSFVLTQRAGDEKGCISDAGQQVRKTSRVCSQFYTSSSCKGFSLVELIVVVAIIGTLSTIAAMNFSSWNKKVQIEKQTREIFSDFNSARTESIFRKKRHSIVFNATGDGYSFKIYNSPDESKFAGTVVYSKKYPNKIRAEDGSVIPDNTTLMYDIRGFALDVRTIRIEPANSGASYDCIVTSPSRTNIGQMSGGACVQK